MAITAPHVELFRSLKPILPHGGRLLHIGEPNWYGDVDPHALLEYAANLQDDPLYFKYNTIKKYIDSGNPFAVAREFYDSIFSPSKVVSVDLNGSDSAIRQDLNKPLNLGDRTFNVCVNHGTDEHVFNIVQVFRTMHEFTVDGGLMIHEAPFTGWVEHGFYCLQPTLFYDLAAAKNYEIVLVAIEAIDPPTIIRLESREHVIELAKADKIPNNSMLFVVYRKRGNPRFLIPLQGYYAQTLSDEGNRAWAEMR